jgi:hypothetical protein
MLVSELAEGIIPMTSEVKHLEAKVGMTVGKQDPETGSGPIPAFYRTIIYTMV